MKTRDAITLLNGIGAVQQQVTQASASFGYHLAVAYRRLREVYVAFEANRRSLVDQFAERDDGGNMIPAPEHGDGAVRMTDAFALAVDLLMNQDVEVEIPTIPLTEVPDMSPGLVAGIEAMIDPGP